MELKKNSLVELEITGYTAEGSGVGRAEGMAVFLPCAAKGDHVLARIVKLAKTYAFGKIEEVLLPSQERVEPGCTSFPQCGGCVYRHISYGEELRAKEQRVRDAVERVGGFSTQTNGLEGPLIRSIIGAQTPENYRNKAMLPIGRDESGLYFGFYSPRSHRLVRCDDCALQPKVFAGAMEAVREWGAVSRDDVYDEAAGKGRLRHLYLRLAEATGQVMVCLVVNGNGVHQEELLVEILRRRVPGLQSVVINSNRERTNVVLGKRCRTVWGSNAITDKLCGLEFEISPLSFYQVNRAQAERLYGIAAGYAGLTGSETLLDLYCGAGTIGLSMAGKAARVIGVEIVPQAVEDAKRNAARNHVENAEFYCMDASQAAVMLKERGEHPDTVILDPPRKGCAPELVETVAGMEPGRIVYVSCDPATLARDLKQFAHLGYFPRELTPVDLFPRTAHVESVALMTRADV